MGYAFLFRFLSFLLDSDRRLTKTDVLEQLQPLEGKLRLRLRITYSKNGAPPVTEQLAWSEP